MSEQPYLRPCPFCGASATTGAWPGRGIAVVRCEDWQRLLTAQPEWRVDCAECGAQGGRSRESDLAAAVKWNRRA